jgi:hemerythrin-like domain-containing protein
MTGPPDASEGILQNLQGHEVVRSHLLDWEAALTQLSTGPYDDTRQAIATFGELCGFVEKEILEHMRKEEEGIYNVLEAQVPNLGSTIADLRREHELIRRTYQEFRRALNQFNAGGQLGELAWLGWDVVHLLRRHMDREERELHPAALRESR